MSKFKVWIDQDLCTGDGLCAEICPSVFEMHEDGLAYVKEPAWKSILGPNGDGPGPALQMADGLASFGEEHLEDVVEAAEDCPGECIFIVVE